MSDDERDEQHPPSDESERDEEPESSQADGADDTGFVADNAGNVEVLEPRDEDGGSEMRDGTGGPGPSVDPFGGMFGSGPFRGRDRFELTEPSFWSRPLRMLLLIAGVFWVGSVLPEIFRYGLTTWGLLKLLGLPLIAGVAIAYRAWKLPSEPLAIELHDEHFELPKGADNPKYVEVDPVSIRSLVMMARGDSEILLMETEKNRFMFSDQDFRDPNGPRLLKDEIMRRLHNHPKGEEIIGRMRRLEELSREASQNPTPVTYTLLGMVVAGYLIEHLTGAIDTGLGLVRLGANSAPLIADGQWWRLISGNFLHGNFLHIFLNGIALLFLGTYVERLIGSWRFLAVYLVAAIGGAAGSFLWTGAHLSVGASTALYGLFGAFGVIHLKYWREVPPPYRQTVLWWVVILGLNFGISLIPMVDAAAHFAGIGVGALITFPVVWDMKSLEPTKEATLWVKGLTAAMTALFAAGLGIASNYAQHDHPADRTKVYAYMVEEAEGTESPTRLNQTAWQIAIDPAATRSQFELGKRAVNKAIDLAEAKDSPEWTRARLAYRDTLATLEYRLGVEATEKGVRREHLREAVRIEYQVVDELRSASKAAEEDALSSLLTEGSPTERSQLARFLDAYLDDFGRYEVGESLGEELALTLEARNESLALRLKLPKRVEQDTELVVLTFDNGRRIGAFRVCLPTDEKGGIVERFGPDHWSTGIGPDSFTRIALTSTEEVDCGGERSVEYWPMSPQVRGWP